MIVFLCIWSALTTFTLLYVILRCAKYFDQFNKNTEAIASNFSMVDANFHTIMKQFALFHGVVIPRHNTPSELN